jgi:hypothetical protein
VEKRSKKENLVVKWIETELAVRAHDAALAVVPAIRGAIAWKRRKLTREPRVQGFVLYAVLARFQRRAIPFKFNV